MSRYLTKRDRALLEKTIKSTRREALLRLKVERMLRLKVVSERLGIDKREIMRIIRWHLQMTNIHDRMHEPKFPQFYHFERHLYITQGDLSIFRNYLKWLYNYLDNKTGLRNFIKNGKRLKAIKKLKRKGGSIYVEGQGYSKI